jgi:hypothetical protein
MTYFYPSTQLLDENKQESFFWKKFIISHLKQRDVLILAPFPAPGTIKNLQKNIICLSKASKRGIDYSVSRSRLPHVAG